MTGYSLSASWDLALVAAREQLVYDRATGISVRERLDAIGHVGPARGGDDVLYALARAYWLICRPGEKTAAAEPRDAAGVKFQGDGRRRARIREQAIAPQGF